MLRKIQIFKALDIEIKKQKGPSTIKRPYKDHKSLKEELGQSRISIIAEISGGNPMHGRVRQSFRPSTHAKSLLENGAKALSVATDPFLYASNDKHLSEVRSVVACPLIRRDFIFEEYQVEESKILGADAIFLSAALLEVERIKALQKLAVAKNLDVVVEVASESDIETALEAEAQIICVVGRNLDTWELSWEKAIKLIKKVPPKQCLRLVEAGISNLKQVKELETMGVHGVIIGDALLNEFYPGKRLAQLLAGIEPKKTPVKKPPKPSNPVPEPAKSKSSKLVESQPSTSSKRPTKGNKETSMTQAKKAETTAATAAHAEKKLAPKKAAPAKKAVAPKKAAAKKAAPAKKAVAPKKAAAKKAAPAKKAVAPKKIAAKKTTTKTTAKPVAKKAAPKKIAAKPAAKKVAPKKKVVAKPLVKKTTKPAAKPVAKKAAPKKKVVAKPLVKKTTKPAAKPVAKKAAPKSTATKKPTKTVVKKALTAKKPAPKTTPSAKKPAAKKGCKK